MRGEEDQYATANTEYAVADSGQHFCISGADVIDGEREELPPLNEPIRPYKDLKHVKSRSLCKTQAAAPGI